MTPALDQDPESDFSLRITPNLDDAYDHVESFNTSNARQRFKNLSGTMSCSIGFCQYLCKYSTLEIA